MSNLLGQTLGRYTILEQLGEGGMAVVYKAYDTRLETDVAVKVIRTERLAPEILERSLKRFEREAKSLARLTHPNIIKVTDYGEHEGKPYLVMEYLPGGTLKERLKAGPLPWQEAIQLLLPITHALEYAHEHNLIHRDVKPSNILLTEKGQPMLTDFGVAKLFDMDSTADLTGTGMGIGTPEYMAPEQWTGKVSPQTDVYALGVVLYEMVAGRKPYIADTPAALLLKQANDPLPKPRNFVTNLPEAVEKVLFQALAKNAEDRYQSMGELANALEGLAAGRPVKETPPAQQVQREETRTMHEFTSDAKTQTEAGTILPRKPAGKKWMWGMAGVLVLLVLAGWLWLGRGESNSVQPLTETPSPPITVEAPVIPSEVPISPTPAPLTGIPLPEGALALYNRGGVNAMDVSATQVAVGVSMGIYLYDPATLETQIFLPTASQVTSLAFSPDGRLLAAGMAHHGLEVWDAASGQLIYQLEKMEGMSDGRVMDVPCLDWSEANDLLAVCMDYPGRHELHLLDPGTWQARLSIRDLDASLQSVKFSPDGNRVATGQLNWLRVWDVASGSLVYEQKDDDHYVRQILFTPDGSLVLALGGRGITFHEAASGTRLEKITPPDYNHGEMERMLLSLDGKTLVVGMLRSLDFWDVTSRSVRDSIDLTQSAIGQLGWNAQGDLILSSTDGSLRIWNAESKTTLSLLEEHPHQADGVTVLPDGKTLAVTSGYRLDIWDIPTNSRRKIIPNTEHLNDPAISPDGTTLAVCSNGDGLWLIDTQNWERRDVMIPGEVPWRLAWSPDGKMLGAVSADDILLWDMPSRNLLGQLSPSAYSLESFMDFSFSPDSRYLAAKFNPSAQDSDQLWVFDATTRQSVTILDASVPGQWSQDGKRILSANRDGLLWLDPFGGTPASLLPLEDIRVQQLRFSPDYSMIAMAYANSPEDLGIISLADPTDGRILHTFHGHRADISDLRFLPDGRTLAAVSWDGVVILWDVSPYLQ